MENQKAVLQSVMGSREEQITREHEGNIKNLILIFFCRQINMILLVFGIRSYQVH